MIAPSAIPFNPTDPAPIVLDQAGIDGIVASFEAAAGRALEAGFKVVEIHAAHGYLLHEFLSPLANFRSDAYGGSLENRMRLPLRVAETVRARVPRGLPVFMRISATDWVKGGWDIEQSIEFARRAKERGIDLIDVSSVRWCRMPRFRSARASRSPSPSAFAPRRRSKPRRSA